MSEMLVSSDSLTPQDVDLIQTFYQKNVESGDIGEVLPLATQEGDQVVAVLTADNSNLLCAFGKVADWYCAIDTHSNVLAKAQVLGDLVSRLTPASLN
ncbi:hypothetical protein A9Q97_03345 [Rhodospirillales bacterium 47_12_T64]|nr:hypothetical protein A9Q97_03345 [Rhodospirillales bacterium 47_12_T64]